MRLHFFSLLTFMIIMLSYTHASTLYMASERLEEVDEKTFLNEVLGWKERGIKLVHIGPQRIRNKSFLKGGGASEKRNTHGAELFYFVSVGETQADQSILSDDYSAMYRVIRIASIWKFKITVSLDATASDLKAALGAKVPTVIFWTGHGNKTGFYDSRSEKIPETIFKNASPMVYQFVLSSCHGRQALDNVYLKHAPLSMHTWAWSDLVYRRDLKDYVEKQWNLFQNLPDFSFQGLSCETIENKSYMTNGQKRLNNNAFDSRNHCLRFLLYARDGFICHRLRKGGESTTYSISQAAPTKGQYYNDINDCINRLGSVRDGKLCRREGKIVYMINRDNKILREMSDMNQCVIELAGEAI